MFQHDKSAHGRPGADHFTNRAPSMSFLSRRPTLPLELEATHMKLLHTPHGVNPDIAPFCELRVDIPVVGHPISPANRTTQGYQNVAIGRSHCTGTCGKQGGVLFREFGVRLVHVYEKIGTFGIAHLPRVAAQHLRHDAQCDFCTRRGTSHPSHLYFDEPIYIYSIHASFFNPQQEHEISWQYYTPWCTLALMIRSRRGCNHRPHKESIPYHRTRLFHAISCYQRETRTLST